MEARASSPMQPSIRVWPANLEDTKAGCWSLLPDRRVSCMFPIGASIWTVNSRGVIASFAENIVVPNCAADLPAELPKPHIRGLAVDAKGDVYGAAIGCRAVVRITSSGQITAVLRAENPWSPSAVAVDRGDLYVMEYDNTLAEYPADGRPRIRKLSSDGKVTTLLVVNKASSTTRLNQ